MAKHSVITDAEASISSDGHGGYRFSEPVMAGALATWLVGEGGTLLVGQLHVIPGPVYEALTSKAVLMLTFLLMSGMGLVLRQFVTPAWRLIERDLGIRLPSVVVDEGPSGSYAIDAPGPVNQAPALPQAPPDLAPAPAEDAGPSYADYANEPPLLDEPSTEN